MYLLLDMYFKCNIEIIIVIILTNNDNNSNDNDNNFIQYYWPPAQNTSIFKILCALNGNSHSQSCTSAYCIFSAQSQNQYNSAIVLRKVGILTSCNISRIAQVVIFGSLSKRLMSLRKINI